MRMLGGDEVDRPVQRQAYDTGATVDPTVAFDLAMLRGAIARQRELGIGIEPRHAGRCIRWFRWYPAVVARQRRCDYQRDTDARRNSSRSDKYAAPIDVAWFPLCLSHAAMPPLTCR